MTARGHHRRADAPAAEGAPPPDPRAPWKRKTVFLAGFGLYFAALWFLWETPAIYPLKIFVVMLHEISHAIAAVATGGTIEKIVLNQYQGGACHCPGGNAFITLSAGYLGSLLWGVAILGVAGTRRIPARIPVFLMGIMVVALTIFYVRDNIFGIAFGLAFGLVMILAGRKLGDGVNRILMTTLGLTSCLYAILDIKSDVLDRPHLRSDAAMLAELTGIPTMTWGVAWIGIALLVSVFAFRRAYRAA